MANLNTPTKHAFKFKKKSLTEQEHKDSCDINKMIGSLNRGQQVRMQKTKPAQWDGKAFDDMSANKLDIMIEKERLEKDLSVTMQTNEFTEEQAKHIPNSIKEKFGIKIKKESDETKTKKASKNDEQKSKTNDDTRGKNRKTKSDDRSNRREDDQGDDED